MIYLQTSRNCTSISNLDIQNARYGLERMGIISLAARQRIGNVSSRQAIGATQLPGMRRWEGGGLRAPLLPKAEVLRPTLRENSSMLVVCSRK